jgi:AraC family transcriptional regulator, regulatory protein of adaptative response / DNA-3-methyladenine glycosylase II
MLDPRICYRALRTRDERFDGRLFVGVTSTGIYCRPICPAGPARPENCRFFPSAAAAQEAGFRPCLRCRPETAPELGSWRGTSNTVSRGLALIAEGELDGEEASVEHLAERLGVGARQLRRLFQQHLGASPITVAQTRRVLFAKQLIHDTRLPMAEIAMAAGFGSVRRFNETFQQLFRRPPSAIRRRLVVALPEGSVGATGVTVHLRYRPPFDWPAVLSFLSARAIDGVEEVAGGAYRRTISIDGQVGTVEVSHRPDIHSLAAAIRFPGVRALQGIVARIRRVFDVGADVGAIGEHLSRDPMLAPLVAARPGLRVPGAWDGFELAARAILGQQVTVEAARQLGGRLARACAGDREVQGGALRLTFPDPAQVAAADLAVLGMPGARRRALAELARAAMAEPLLFQPLGTVEETVARLRAIPGVGEWTAQYIALRAAREPDAFPASDRGLLRGAARGGREPTPAALEARAERWRPWRAYAAQHLWAADAARVASPDRARRGRPSQPAGPSQPWSQP